MQPIRPPRLFLEGAYQQEDIDALRRSEPVWSVHDSYEAQSKELFEITHPSLRGQQVYAEEEKQFLEQRRSAAARGDWVYYPWSGRLVHMVNQHEYRALRTNRNQHLITEQEQQALAGFTVGIAGLSVGSQIAVSLAYSGIADILKLAEHDSLDTTNLNRLRARLDQIGQKKITIAAEQIYEIHPTASLVLFGEGLTSETVLSFVAGDPKPKLIFEIIDNFEMKIQLRLAARTARVPVIMLANLGDQLLIDIERYDLDGGLALFNGVVGETPEEILANPDVTETDKHRYAIELVGREHVPQRALNSVRDINKTLVGRPQLMSTVTVAAGLAAYLARSIALGQEAPSGRYLVPFHDTIFGAL